MDSIREFTVLKEIIKGTNKNTIIETNDGEQFATILNNADKLLKAERITIFIEGKEIEFVRC